MFRVDYFFRPTPSSSGLVTPDLSAYALKTELPAPVNLAPYALKTELPAPVDVSVFATKAEIPIVPPPVNLEPYALKTEIPPTPDLTPYAKIADLPGAVDLSSYALKTEIPVVPPPVNLDPYALKTEIPSLPDLSLYALKSELANVSSGGVSNLPLVEIPNGTEYILQRSDANKILIWRFLTPITILLTGNFVGAPDDFPQSFMKQVFQLVNFSSALMTVSAPDTSDAVGSNGVALLKSEQEARVVRPYTVALITRLDPSTYILTGGIQS